MESIVYKSQIIGYYHEYVTGVDHIDKKGVGRITFEGIDALIKLLTAPDNDEINCAYFGKETVEDFKRRIEKTPLAIYLSTESEIMHEGPGGVKERKSFTFSPE